MEKRLKANPNTKADVNTDVEGSEVDDEDDNRGLSGSADDVITRGENKNAISANVSTGPGNNTCRAPAGVLYLYKRYIAAQKPICKLYRSLTYYFVLYVL